MPDMLELKHKLHEVAEHFRPDDQVIYLDIPFHMNVGDLLINSGTENFFAEHKIRVSRRYTLDDVPETIPGLNERTLLVFHGGGNFGDLWQPHHAVRERTIVQNPNIRCIIMPQTVHFSSPEAEQKSLRALSQHKHLQVFARDQISLQKMIDGGLRSAKPMPDMAHSLYGVMKRLPVRQSGTMTMIRRDREATGNKPQATGTVDWDDIVPFHCRVLRKVISQIAKTDRLLGFPADHTRLFYPVRDMAVESAVTYFSQTEQVVADRLHATILSLLLGIPIRAIDNSYGKLSTYCSAWLKGCPGLTLAWEEK
jgi:pyruvyl transferase EpsO